MDDSKTEKMENHRSSQAAGRAWAVPSLPGWVTKNLRSSRSWKLLLRCWIATWISFVILLPDKSLNTLGTTAFFTILASLFLPAYLPVQMFLIAATMLMTGVLLGWGLGVAAMRAANAVRNRDFLQSVYHQIQQSIASNPDSRAQPYNAFTLAIYQGAFLEVRSSAVYGCFLGAGALFFALVRSYAPKLIFLSIFGTIAIDIFCTIGPLLPDGEYTLLRSMAISSASYIATACLATLVVFPQTTNHVCMHMISVQLSKIQSLIMMQEEVLDSSPEDLTFNTPVMDKLRTARSELIAGQQQLSSMMSTINLEFSMGKWNEDDLREVTGLLVSLVVRTAALQSYARLVGDSHSDVLTDSPESSATTSLSSTETAPTPGTTDSYLFRQIQQRKLDAEKLHSVGIVDLIPIVRQCTLDLRGACVAGLKAAQASIDGINTRRWRGRGDIDEQDLQNLEQAIAALSAARSAFKETNRKSIIAPYATLISEARSKEEQDSLPLRSLYVSFVFLSDLLLVANSTVDIMERVRDKMLKRQKNRLWAPKGLRQVGKIIFLRTSKEDSGFGEDDASDPVNDEVDMNYCRDPDSKPPTNIFQRLMDQLHKLWVWCGTANAKFTFKYAIISIALWLPSVLKSSAFLYFRERGIWALVMAQTTLNVYAADQIFNLICRLTGTLAGLALGLIAWYAGNGRGNGNPYGAAASVGVLLIPIIFVRIFSPAQYLAGVILGCATFALIVGYSWVDGHIFQVVTVGVGWTIAWKRWVLVVIGAAASFIIMMFPPTSGRKAVRIGNAASVLELSNVYGFLTSMWISTRLSEQQHQTPAAWLPDFRARLLAHAEKINTLQRMTQMARWEGSIRGAWPVEEYARLVDVQRDMVSSLAHLGGALGHLEDSWRLTFLHSTKVLNPHFISDVMAIFALVSQSLRTGEPMHQVLPTTLIDRLFYHHRSGPTGHKLCIDAKEVETVDYMFYSTGLVAVYQLLTSLDELHRITKRLCGEVPLAGFGNWRREYDRMHRV